MLQDIHKLNWAQVTRAIALEIAKGNAIGYGGLLLDLSPNMAHTEGQKLWQQRAALGQLDILLGLRGKGLPLAGTIRCCAYSSLYYGRYQS